MSKEESKHNFDIQLTCTRACFHEFTHFELLPEPSLHCIAFFSILSSRLQELPSMIPMLVVFYLLKIRLGSTEKIGIRHKIQPKSKVFLPAV